MNDDDFKLIYQPVPPSTPDEAFASALEDVVAGSTAIAIASPYLSLDVLRPLVEGRGFRLVTDVVACFEAGGDHALAEFLREKSEHIKTLRGLHAKVVLGDHAGLFGSANLTTTGLCQRYEMACLVRGRRLDELKAWFDAVWEHGDSLEVEDLTAHATKPPAPTEASPRATKRLPTTGRLGWLASPRGVDERQRGPTSPSASQSAHVTTEELEELAMQLREVTTDSELAVEALKLFADALEFIDLPVHDDRLHLNFGRRPISITLGQRYVVWLRKQGGTPEFGLLLADFDVAKDYVGKVPGVRSRAFRAKGKPDVPILHWPLAELSRLPQDVRENWRKGVLQQLDRCRTSSYAGKKRPALYHILRDRTLWSEAVRLAHPSAR